MQAAVPTFLSVPTIGWRRDLWLAILIAASVGFSLLFACVTPFGALAVVAAMTLSFRSAVKFMLVAWLANQSVGVLILDYPQTLETCIWGAVIAASGLCALYAARWTAVKFANLPELTRFGTTLLSAVAAHELVLFAAALSPLGGADNFSPEILAGVMAVNVVSLAGMCALNQLALATGLMKTARLTG